MNRAQRILLIDDDPINNYMNKIIIHTVNNDAAIISFTDPNEGFEYVKRAYSFYGDEKIILFLDINMPGMTGWDFMERFEALPPEIQSHYDSYILSSSVNDINRRRAQTHPAIKGFIEKPMPNEMLEEILA